LKIVLANPLYVQVASLLRSKTDKTYIQENFMELAGLPILIIVMATITAAGFALIYCTRKFGQFCDQINTPSKIAAPSDLFSALAAGSIASYGSYAADDTGADFPEMVTPDVINPATGLAMVAGIGSVDVGGNLWGSFGSLVGNMFSHDINPTTGLPMVDGIGSVDVGGNLWGSVSSLFDSLGHGASAMGDFMTSSWDSHSLMDSDSTFDSFNNDW
jgi:hypothetical protein